MSDLEWVRRDGVGRWEAEAGGSLRLIGPMTVPFDDPGVNNTYTSLTTLAPGTAIVRVWATNQGWVNSPDAEAMEVTADVQVVGGSSTYEVYRVNNALLDTNTVLELRDATPPADPTDPARAHAAVVPATSDWELAAYIFVNGNDTPSAGSLDFYALAFIPA